MKKIVVIFMLPLFFSCKQSCVSCIAETPGGKIVENSIECDRSGSYLDGFIAGFKSKYAEHGDTMTVTCDYDN